MKLVKSATEAYATFKEVYGHEYLSRTQMFEWFERCTDGFEMTKDGTGHR